MPRVPAAKDLGIGNVAITTNVSTPMQSFTVPNMDDGSTSKIGAAISSGASKVTNAIQASIDKNEKRALLVFQTKVDALNNEMLLDPETGLASKTGGEALELIQGNRWVGQPEYIRARLGVDTLANTYKGRLEDIKAEVGAGLSDQAQKSLGIAALGETNRFTAAVNKAQIEAQAKVDMDLVTKRISDAAEKAAGSVGSGTKVMAAAIGTSLKAVEAAVRDKHIGLAAQKGVTDPDLVKEMVKDQQAIVYKRVIEQMVASGDIIGAMTLLDDQTKEGGTLRGTPESVTLNTQVLTARQSQKGKQLFGRIRVWHPTDVSAQLHEISKIKDPTDQALAMSEWKAHHSLVNIEKRDQIQKETVALVTFMQKYPDVPIDPLLYPALSQFAPRVIFEAGRTRRRIAVEKVRNATDTAHVAAGGSAFGNTTVVDNLLNMASDPKQLSSFIQLMDNPKNIKRFTNASQWVQLQSKVITARTAEINATAGFMAYDKVLKDLGFKSSQSKYKSLIQNPDLHTAINDTRQRVFNQTGKAATMDDILPIVAKFALPVDRSWSTKPTLYHLSEYSKTGTVDFKTMLETPLDLDIDRDLKAVHFALDRKASVKEIRDIVTAYGKIPINLRMIAEKVKGGIDALKLGAWEQDQVDFNNAVLSMGYPPDFIAAMLDAQNNREGLPHTEENAQAVADQLMQHPKVYEKQFTKWAAGEDF